MSKFKQPSVSDSFNAPSNKPGNPNDINGYQMLFQLGLVIAGGIAIGLTMYLSNKWLMKEIVEKIGSAKQLADLNTLPTQMPLPSTTKQEEGRETPENSITKVDVLKSV